MSWFILTLEAFTIFLLCSFMIISAVSFFKFRLNRKVERYQNTLKLLEVSEGSDGLIVPAISDEFSPKDFWLPIAFATLICMLGFFQLFFGLRIIQNPCFHNSNILFVVLSFGKEGIDLKTIQMTNLVVMAMAFLGAFTWSTMNIIKRVLTYDLTPGVYYSSGLRMVICTLFGLMLSVSSQAKSPIISVPYDWLPVVAFFVGWFPEVFVRGIKEKIFNHLNSKKVGKAHKLPLNMMEGMNAFNRARLSEIGIDNAQNLAESNLLELLAQTSYNAKQLIDWIGQAKLYVYLKDDYQNLNKLGVRTVFDFITACKTKDLLEGISKASNIPEMTLSLLQQRFIEDKWLDRLNKYKKILERQ